MLEGRHRKITAAKWTDGPKFRTGWLLAAVLLLFGVAIPAVVLAQSASDQLASGLNSAQSIGLGTADVRTMVSRIINYFFGLIGIVVTSLFIYGGYVYMMAKGDASEIDRAKKIMVNAAIGVLIILSAYAIAQFVIRAIFGANEYGGVSGTGGGSAMVSGYCQGCGPEHLGNGIIVYHYPEANQTDVPRNVSIAIKFKKPLLPSTVLLDYDDKGTYDVTDDEICNPTCTKIDWANPPAFSLNTENIKVLPVSGLQDISGSSDDEYFDSRYDSEDLLTDAQAFVSQVSPEFDPNNLGQDIVIVPPANAPLGSSKENVEYRVALRGGDNGLKVWTWDAEEGEAELENAFSQLNPDGSYFWNFTTGTTIDLTPPEIRSIIPVSRQDPMTDRLFRNQLLQVYFSKPMNPVTVSGINGSGGFSMIEVVYERSPGDWQPLEGTWVSASGYKAIEYTPSTPCDNISQNSCGDKVYCLPGDTKIAVRVKAPGLSDSPPRAAMPFNGVVDMVSNALDGDADSDTEGPGSFDLIALGASFMNPGSIPLTNVKANFSNDSVLWLYYVGNSIDLVPPTITSLDPPNSNPGGIWDESNPQGASQFPVDRPITAIWSKPMSISSMITGPDTYTRATITLRAKETVMTGTPPGPPGYSVIPSLVNDDRQTLMTMTHRVFFTANDLGWPPEIAKTNTASVPVYVPVFKYRLKDSRQNCFFPSYAINCDDPSGMDENSGLVYCCDFTVNKDIGAACQQ